MSVWEILEEEYELTRHNAGRMAVLELARKEGMGELVFDKKLNALVGKGEIGGPAFAKASAGKEKNSNNSAGNFYE